MKRALLKFIFSISGWKVVGKKPAVSKYIIIIAPHTSNWDFFVGVAARSIAFIKSYFLIKKSFLDTPVIGWVIKWTGGFPVDRSKSTNMVDQLVEAINKSDEFTLTITPEGTRARVEKWKTGFWHIAKNAHIPVVMVGFDYAEKTVYIKEPIYMSNDKDADIEKMKAYFRTVTGCHPELGVV